ncbi:IS66 family insertion sequence element accessory protein TnpA [Novipirellula artificiosorum]|uniref:Transposase n=1 Tax=Novipirellula artificiosorum TaxID=2528016 RepID=A0A5C6CX08_9BACT|nr:hypothetical protein [Novipirellula artificiosorum]TWU29040.1 hypothetical protein Poly41_67390 [Novipirellula artificiosorum]
MSRSETVKLWQERLRRFDRSRMTVLKFCRNEGVSQPSFYRWKKKLCELPSDAKPKPKPSTTGVQFMPLRLATESANQVAPKTDEQAGSSLACTTIELPGGVRIRVEVPTDRHPGQRVEARA